MQVLLLTHPSSLHLQQHSSQRSWYSLLQRSGKQSEVKIVIRRVRKDSYASQGAHEPYPPLGVWASATASAVAEVPGGGAQRSAHTIVAEEEDLFLRTLFAVALQPLLELRSPVVSITSQPIVPQALCKQTLQLLGLLYAVVDSFSWVCLGHPSFTTIPSRTCMGSLVGSGRHK